MQTVLIIGATSDMGFAIAKKFAAEKYAIQLAGRNTAQLDLLAADLRIRYQVPCSVHEFDALNFDSHTAFYTGLPTSPDISVSVVGYMNDNEVVIKSQAETIKTINANFTGLASLLNIIAEDYATKKRGVIAGISSVAGLRGRQSNYIYGSAKAGFTAYLSGLRNKLYHDNVHVLTILPGFVYTKMTADLTLPPLLTATPELVAEKTYNAIIRKKNVIYVKWFWKWIMLIIRLIPEPIFKKKKL